MISFSQVTGHVWENVDFMYAAWQQPNTLDGFVDIQSAVYTCSQPSHNCEPLGNIQISNSTRITFSSCTFAHLGGVYALSILNGFHYVSIVNCYFNDLSGGAIKLGNVVNSAGASSNDMADWDTNADVTNNLFSEISLEYHGAAAVFVGYVFSADISNNTITDTGYTGISLGWGWGNVFPQGK